MVDGQGDLDSWELGPGEWPTTREAAAQDLLSWLGPEAREKLRFTRRERLISLHHSLGLAIRNRHGLWRGNTALIESCLGHPGDPDTVSIKILERAWELAQE